MNSYIKQDAIIFKALCDEKRLHVLSLLQQGETCACELMEKMDIAQSALSYHMKILCNSKIVIARQEGKWTHYRLSEEGSKYAIQRLEMITTTKTDTKKSCCK